MKNFIYSFLFLGLFLFGAQGLVNASAEGDVTTLQFFPDLDNESIEGQAAANLRYREIIHGRPDGNFDGTASVNRAEIAKFLMLAKGITVGNLMNNGKFPDVLEGEWYVPFVMKAHQIGVLNGYPSGNFDPARSVNTIEFLKMAVKTFGLEENLPHSFTDVPAGEWFAPFAGVVKKYELFPRRSDTLLEPARTLTRNEVAVAIYRIIRPKSYDDVVEGVEWVAGNTTNINAKTTNTLPIISTVYAGKENLEVMSLELVASHNVTLKKLVFETIDSDFFSLVWLKDSGVKVAGNTQTITLDLSQSLSANQAKTISISADTSANKNNGDSETLTLKSIEWETNGVTEIKNVSIPGYQIMISDATE